MNSQEPNEIEKSPELGLKIRNLEIKSQESNENSYLDNQLSDGGSLGAEGVMALPDSVELKKSPEPGLEIKN